MKEGKLKMTLYEQVNDELFLEISVKSHVFGSKTTSYHHLLDIEKGRRKPW